MLEQDEKNESGYWVTGTEKPMQRGREADSADTPAGSMILRPTERVAFSHVLYFVFWVVSGCEEVDGYGRKANAPDRHQTDLLQCAVGCGSW